MLRSQKNGLLIYYKLCVILSLSTPCNNWHYKLNITPQRNIEKSEPTAAPLWRCAYPFTTLVPSKKSYSATSSHLTNHCVTSGSRIFTVPLKPSWLIVHISRKPVYIYFYQQRPPLYVNASCLWHRISSSCRSTCKGTSFDVDYPGLSTPTQLLVLEW